MPESIWSVKIQFTILAIFFATDHDPTRIYYDTLLYLKLMFHAIQVQV